MAKRIEYEARLTVPLEAYWEMRTFAEAAWNEIKQLGHDKVFGYGYFERTAKELGIDSEDDE